MVIGDLGISWHISCHSTCREMKTGFHCIGTLPVAQGTGVFQRFCARGGKGEWEGATEC